MDILSVDDLTAHLIHNLYIAVEAKSYQKKLSSSISDTLSDVNSRLLQIPRKLLTNDILKMKIFTL